MEDMITFAVTTLAVAILWNNEKITIRKKIEFRVFETIAMISHDKIPEIHSIMKAVNARYTKYDFPPPLIITPDTKIIVKPILKGVFPQSGGNTGITNAQRKTAIINSDSQARICFSGNFVILFFYQN
jgi:hypothetical protein